MPASECQESEYAFGGSDITVRESEDRPCEWEIPYQFPCAKAHIRQGLSSGLWWLGSQVLPSHAHKTKPQVETQKGQILKIRSGLKVRYGGQFPATDDV